MSAYALGSSPAWAHRPRGSWTRKLRVVTVGAGLSGINMAYSMRKFLPAVEHTVYEKNSDIGGTWLENRYAGCACDVPSHTYQLSWAPNPRWTKYYSSSQEILRYLQDTVASFELGPLIKLEHTVQSAVWVEAESKWHLEILTPDGQVIQDTADFLINGSGILNNWKWPAIDGLQTFKGTLMHSAKWDPAYNFEGKTVGVVGTGSSGVQIVAALEPVVKSMKVFLRSPIWVTPSIGGEFAGPDGRNFEYTLEEIHGLEASPTNYKAYIQKLDNAVSGFTAAFYNDAPEQRIFKDLATKDMLQRLKGNADLGAKIIPTFPLGCRRPVPGNGFLESLTQEHVEAVTDGIGAINATGIVMRSGRQIDLDTIVCATGFDVSLRPRFPVVGREGDLSDQWARKPEGYMGIAVENLPNYFVSLGPSSPVAHGSLIPVIERVSHYIIKSIHRFETDASMASMCPRQEAVQDFNSWREEPLKQLVWSANCSSWFKNGDAGASPFAVHPGSRAHYLEMLSKPRWEDFSYTYSDNRFAYLGNGKSATEAAGEVATEHLDEVQRLW